MKRSVLVVTSGHPIDDVRVHHKFVRSFLAADWNVSWLGTDRGSPPPEAQAIKYALIPDDRRRASRLGRIPQLIAKGRRPIAASQWIYCPDPDAVIAALLLSRKHGSYTIFDIHEMYHDTHLQEWIGHRGVQVSRNLLKATIRELADRCDIVLSPSRAVLDAYSSSSKHPQRFTVLNTVPLAFGSEVAFARALQPARSTRFIMHGKIGPGRGTVELAQALALVHEQTSLDLRAIAFADARELRHFLDLAQPGLAAQAAQYFDCREAVPPHRMPEVLAECSAGIIGYTGAMAAASLGNRTFEYLAASIPLVAPVESPLISEIIRSHNCGLTFTNDDPASLANALIQMFSDELGLHLMGSRGKAAFDSYYSWEAEFAKLLTAMKSIDLNSLVS